MALVITLISLLITAIICALTLFRRRKTVDYNKDKSFDRDGVDVVSQELDSSGNTIVHIRATAQWVRRNLPDASWTDHQIIAFHLAHGVMGPNRYVGLQSSKWDASERFNVWAYRREGGR